MPDVFISYARPDEPQAQRVAEMLRAHGYKVWRDDELPAHRPYADVIAERLKSAKAVVVLWTTEAVKSEWVRAEADIARTARTLVQVTADGAIPPIPFNQIQCANLQDWKGSTDAPGWRKLIGSVAALVRPAEAAADTKSYFRQRSVCVLPFANMSGDPEQEYFSDGITEDITTDLSKVSALAVTARNTAFTLKGQAVDVCEVARKLEVSHVLEGSVRKAGGRLRITAQLIDGQSGDHVWAERFDRDLTDIFAIQDEISEAIVSALKIKLLPEEKEAIEHRGTSSVDAYNFYLMARQYWVLGDFGDARREQKVIRICERATQIDSKYPQPWALMALAQANLRHGFSGNDSLDDGAAAADRALTLDPTIAEAHLPKAWNLAARGLDAEANAEVATALRLGPNSWEVNKESARLYYRQGRLEDAARYLEKATELMETDFHGLGMLFACYNASGDLRSAKRIAEKIIVQVENVIVKDPDNGAALAFGALSFAMIGQIDRAAQWMERGMLVDPDNWMMRYNFAWGLNKVFKDEEGAIEMLRPVLENGGQNIIRLAANDPNLDNLREDLRMQQMMDIASKRVAELSRQLLK